MPDTQIRMIPGRWADYVRKLMAMPRDSIYNSRVNFYKHFAGLCKRHPKQFKMKWFAGYIMYEEFKFGVWQSVSSPAEDMYDEIRYFEILK